MKDSKQLSTPRYLFQKSAIAAVITLVFAQDALANTTYVETSTSADGTILNLQFTFDSTANTFTNVLGTETNSTILASNLSINNASDLDAYGYTTFQGKGTYGLSGSIVTDKVYFFDASNMPISQVFNFFDVAADGTLTLSQNTLPTTVMSSVETVNPNTLWYNPSVSSSLTPVPVPGAIWFFVSGIIGLTGLARKRKTV